MSKSGFKRIQALQKTFLDADLCFKPLGNIFSKKDLTRGLIIFGSVNQLSKSCFSKISGITEDIFGYRREVSIRGCPLISLFTKLEEGCTSTSLKIAGIGLIEGVVCFCNEHLCNHCMKTQPCYVTLALCILVVYCIFKD